MRSFVNQFCNLVFSMQGPIPPQTTPAQQARTAKRYQKQGFDRYWRNTYCKEVIDILNDPDHNKTTE